MQPSPLPVRLLYGTVRLLFQLVAICWSLSSVSATPPGAPLSANIKVDQFGYPVNARKIAVVSNPVVGYNNAETFTPGLTYEVRRWDTDAVAFTGTPAAWKGGQLHPQSGDKVWWFDFSNLTTPGEYYVLDVAKNVRSESFRIGDDVYDDVMKAATKMFFYQRSGFDKTATYAGTWADGPAFVGPGQDTESRSATDPTNAATAKNLSGGWFDAGDYTKYTNFTFSVLVNLMTAYEERPSVFGDNNNIPESGNGVPDLLDEAKWELDWLLKMQQSDGSVLSKVGVNAYQGASPPSATTDSRYYDKASTSSTLTTAAVFALAARQYKSLSDPTMQAYGDVLKAAAIKAYAWAAANPNVLSDNAGFLSAATEVTNYDRAALRITAAIYLFALTGDATYRDYVDANYENLNVAKPTSNFVFPYDQPYQDAVLYYAKTAGGTAAVASNIKTRYENGVKNGGDNFPNYLTQEDAYRAFLKDGNYTWGSNHIKNNQALIYYNMIQAGLDPGNTARYQENAIGYLHYMHGLNPTGYEFLTNMGSYGAGKSVTRAYHTWFGDVSNPTFAHNPPPGYLTGGPNPTYQPDAAYTGPVLSPPRNQPVQKSYIDWDKGYPENGWQITEPAIYYQASYVRALSKAMGGIPAPVADAVKPTTPASLTSADRYLTTVTLNWTASTDNVDVTAYEIYSSGTKIGESTSNRFEVSGLVKGTTYTFTVKAKDRAGNLSDASAPTTVTTLVPDSEAPTAPTDLVASAVQMRQFTLSWTAATDNVGVTGYDIYQDGSKIGETAATTFTVTGLMPSTLYTMTVKAKDAVGNVSTASAALPVTTGANTGGQVLTDKVIYDDAILDGWADISWASPKDFNSTSPVKVGTKAAKISFGSQYLGFGFRDYADADGLNPVDYPNGLSFWAYNGGTAPMTGNVVTEYPAGTINSTQRLVTFPVGVWTKFTIPWSELGNPARVQQFDFINFTHNDGDVISFDDVRFLKADQAANVTFSPGGGNYLSNQTVTLATATPDATIRYTTDGSAPAINSGTVYTGPITVAPGTTVRAIAYKTGLLSSGITQAVYTLGASSDQVIYGDAMATGWDNWSSSTFDITNTSTVKVGSKSIKAMPDAAYQAAYFHAQTPADLTQYSKGLSFWIYGGTPNGGNANVRVQVQTVAAIDANYQWVNPSSQKQYEVPVGRWTRITTKWSEISNPTAAQMVVIQDASGAAGQVFYIDDVRLLTTDPAADVAISPNGSTFIATQTVTLSTTTAGASIRYTTDGSLPSETTGTLYGNPFTLSATAIVNAIAYKTGTAASDVTSATFTQSNAVSAVTFSPGSSVFSSTQPVTLSTLTPGASIRYTTDGSDPSESAGTLYAGPITVTSSQTIRAIAYKTGATTSAITSAAYTLETLNPNDEVVYDDQLRNGWQNYSYQNEDFDFANTSPVRSGTKSIKANIASYGYESAAFNRPTVVNTADFPQGYSFWAYGGTAVGNNATVKIGTYIQTVSGAQNLGVKQYEVPVGQWTKFNVAWSDVGNPSQIQYIAIQDQGGKGQVFYIDDVRLLAAPPAANTAPTVVNGISAQTATLNQAYSFSIPANTFTDAETPNSLTISVSGLPTGLSFANGTISGTPSTAGQSSISVTATDPGGLMVSTSFVLTVSAGSVVSVPFAITGVTTVSCTTVSAGLRSVQFTPLYAGVNGQPITFQVVNEMPPTTNAGPYTVQLYTDNPIISLKAEQAGTVNTFAYNWLANCGTATPPANTAPTVVNGISAQTATLNQAYSFSIPTTTFTDAETPNSLTISVSGLPTGLSFANGTISGTPSAQGQSSISVTATDPGGLMVSTSFVLTVTVTPINNGTFAITGVTTQRCETVSGGQRRVSFTPQYSGQTQEPVSFSVVNEMPTTTNPGPYTLNLYTDNPRITLVAKQGSTTVQYTYNWLGACDNVVTPPANTAPTVVNGISAQTATLNQAYSFSIPTTTFSDAETPNSLTISVSGLPTGLSFANGTISGTPSTAGQSSISVTATDPGGLMVSTSFVLTVNAGSVVSVPFAITGVTTVSCTTVSAGLRQLTFTPRYGGLSGDPVSFSVVNELSPTTNAGPYSLNLYTDNPVITLNALQAGAAVSYTYNWLTACNTANARLAADVSVPLQVTLLGNPTAGETVTIEVRGASGQPLNLRVTDMQGRYVSGQAVDEAADVEQQQLRLGQSAGLYLLRVSTPTASRVLTIVRK